MPRLRRFACVVHSFNSGGRKSFGCHRDFVDQTSKRSIRSHDIGRIVITNHEVGGDIFQSEERSIRGARSSERTIEVKFEIGSSSGCPAVENERNKIPSVSADSIRRATRGNNFIRTFVVNFCVKITSRITVIIRERETVTAQRAGRIVFTDDGIVFSAARHRRGFHPCANRKYFRGGKIKIGITSCRNGKILRRTIETRCFTAHSRRRECHSSTICQSISFDGIVSKICRIVETPRSSNIADHFLRRVISS